MLSGASYFPLFAQNKDNQNIFQGWVGYVTSYRFHTQYSLWNDIHYNPTSFLVLRTGITRHFSENMNLTLGYAFTWTAPPFTDELIRKEHRPWGQFVINTPIQNSRLQLNHRIRYDMRFREKIENNILVDDWILVHRVRFMTGLRIPLTSPDRKNMIFFNIFDEAMLNFGETILRNNLDQNRIGIMIGKNINPFTFQIGYMHRFVPANIPNTFTNVHSLVLWINHNLKR